MVRVFIHYGRFKMSRVLFIADIHAGHNGIHNKFRTQFSSEKEHDDFIHHNILSEGNTNTTLWLLGDTYFKSSTFWRLEEIRNKYQQVNIVLGNHCASSLPRFALQFKNVNVYGVQQKYGLWLSHVPIPDYELYRGNCVHGHMHDKVVQDLSVLDHYSDYTDQDITDNRYFCVSCEQVDYKPISLNNIKEIRGWK